MKRITCLGVLTALCLSGCAGQVNETLSTSEALPNPQLQALVQAEAAGLIESHSQDPEKEKASSATVGNAAASLDEDMEPPSEEVKEPSDEVKPEMSVADAEPPADAGDASPSGTEGQSEPSVPQGQVESSVPQVQTKNVAAEGTAEPANDSESVQSSDIEANPEPTPVEMVPEQSVPDVAPEPSASEAEADDITEAEALGSVEEPFDMARYTIEMTDIQLEISPPDSSEVHRFYVFVVKDNAGEEVGQIAVDRETGEKYTYQGEGIIEAYSMFPLYEPQHGDYDWEGEYESPSGLTLAITGRDDGGFTYAFSDGTEGYANITGDTAKSEDGEINFLLSEKIITVAGGGLTGNYDVAT